MKHTFLALGALTTVLIVTAQPALAGGLRDTIRSQAAGDNVLTCQAFTIDDAWNLDVTTRIVSDSSGNLVNSSTELRFNAVLTKWSLDDAPVQLGVYRERGSTHGTYDAVSGMSTYSGLTTSIAGPNGLIAHDVGRTVVNADGTTVFESGQHQTLASQLCYALQ